MKTPSYFSEGECTYRAMTDSDIPRLMVWVHNQCYTSGGRLAFFTSSTNGSGYIIYCAVVEFKKQE